MLLTPAHKGLNQDQFDEKPFNKSKIISHVRVDEEGQFGAFKKQWNCFMLPQHPSMTKITEKQMEALMICDNIIKGIS